MIPVLVGCIRIARTSIRSATRAHVRPDGSSGVTDGRSKWQPAVESRNTGEIPPADYRFHRTVHIGPELSSFTDGNGESLSNDQSVVSDAVLSTAPKRTI